MPIIARQTVGLYSSLHPDYMSAPITASDSVDVPQIPGMVCVGIFNTGAGNIASTTLGGVSASFASVPANSILDAAVRRVLATGTTATGLSALYRASER